MKTALLHPLLLLSVLTGIARPHSALAASASFKGTVLDPDGKPAGGAVVSAYPFRSTFDGGVEISEGTSFVTSDGSFEVGLPILGGVVIARKDGWAPAWKCVSHVQPKMEGTLALTKPTSLSGKVVDESGTPVADAQVSVISATVGQECLTGKLSRDLFHTRTSPDGRFSISGFPADTTPGFEVSGLGRDGKAIGYYYVPWRGGKEDIRLAVEPPGAIEGRIVVEGQDQPPPMATLRLEPSWAPYGDRGAQLLRSRTDGTFRFSDVPAGDYVLRAAFGTNAMPDWVSRPALVTAYSAETNSEVEIKATGGGVVEVTVVDKKTRKALPEAEVIAKYPDLCSYYAFAKTDGAGVTCFRLPPPGYGMMVLLGGMAALEGCEVKEGSRASLELEAAPPVRIQGIIRTPDGKPASDVEVRFVHRDEPPAKTDEKGRFDLPFRYPGENHPDWLFIQDRARNLALAEPVDENTGPLDLTLAPGKTAVVRVESKGVPVTNARVSLMFRTVSSGSSVRGLTFDTKAPGTYQMPALPAGRQYGLYVSAPGFTETNLDFSTLGEEAKMDLGGAELHAVEIKPANRMLLGRVLDQRDKPVADARISIRQQNTWEGYSRSDRKGIFSVQVVDGSLRVEAYARRNLGIAYAQGGDTNVIVRLGEVPDPFSRRLTGVVVDLEGRPVAGADLTLYPMPGRRVKTAPDGSFNMPWTVRPGMPKQQWLIIRHLQRNLAAAAMLVDGITNVQLALNPGLTLAGRVIENPTGAALTNIAVSLRFRMAEGILSDPPPVLTDAKGYFEIKALPPGWNYSLRASAQNYGDHYVEFGSAGVQGRFEFAPFALKRADQVIAGQVVTAEGKPAVRAEIQIMNDEQPSSMITADREGRFRLAVCEGEVELRADGETGYAWVRVPSGRTNLVIKLR